MRASAIRLIFKRSSMPGLPALVCMILAVVFMIMDQKATSFQKIRSDLSLIVLPIQYVVSTPIKIVHWVVSSVATEQELLADNARLRAHELLLESKLQKLLVLERENEQLRELLKSSSYIGGHVQVAQMLAVDLDPSVQQIIVDRGNNHHIYVGQPVLDAYGVVGQVVRVSPLTSKVMVITDLKSAIPVQNSRNGVRAIAVGMGNSGKLALINVPDTADIQQGDVFISSGLGMRYPVGYPVGVVTVIRHDPTQRFASLFLTPSAHLNQSQQLLMVWPDKAALAKAVQEQLQSSTVKKK